MNNDIEEALHECQAYAQKGYDIASNTWNTIHQALLAEERKVKKVDKQQGKISRLADEELIKKKKQGLASFMEMDKELKQDLCYLQKQQKEFSVLVFGRTMVGKSTLMEIMTHGSGASIGNGSQRTTLDVRDYHWKGMKITDVPGIASFDGREDDRLALEAAKAADLILFLISDDGVQQEEAKNLAELRRLGKPVLGIINVKLGITEQVRSLDMKRLRNKMAERERIETICNQFRQFAGNFQQDWGDLTFVPVHLKAAYLGQDKNPELWEVSNFTEVEAYILSKVQQDGCFLRIKTFLDRVIIPLQGRMEMLYENSGSSLTEAFEYQKKCQELTEWKKIFVEDSQEKFNNLCTRVKNKLARGIREFAEDNYENEDAGEDWKEYLQEELKLEADCMSFLQERANKCSRKRRELMDSLKTELTFAGVNVEFDDISMDSIFDTQFWGSAAAIAAGLISGPIGIAIGIVTWLFGSSKEEKIREAKAKLRAALQDAMDECGYVDTLMAGVAKTMNEEIFGKGVEGLYNALAQMDAMLIGLAKEEATGAERLGVLLNQLNCQLLHEAEGYIAAQEGKNLVLSVDRIARIPGEVTVVYDNVNSFDGYEAQMTKLIGEKVELRILDNAGNFYGEMVKKTEELIGSFRIEEVGVFAKVFNEDEVPVIQPTERKLAEIKMNDRYRLVYQYMGMPMVQ
ncbi:MAG: 50S ribosome-binding GTPase [Veillonellaceae bacterium]|nr:50S ribosome-binding GTPase [Veillonellaceae bacterium]